ncbi:hypothetical protein D3C87_1222560 [compost metagenome]
MRGHLRVCPSLVDVDRIGESGWSELPFDAENRGSNLFESLIADRVPPVLGCIEGRTQAGQKLRKSMFQVFLLRVEQLRQGFL